MISITSEATKRNLARFMEVASGVDGTLMFPKYAVGFGVDGTEHLRLFDPAAYFRRAFSRPQYGRRRRPRADHGAATAPTVRPRVAPAHIDHPRCGVRRHRHEPALHDPGMFLRDPFGAAHARECARRAVARHLRARDR